MKTNSLSKNLNFRWLFVVAMGILFTSCGTYQNSSYYDNDGIYGDSNTPQQRSTSNESTQSSYYQNYFSSINQESQELFTNVDTYKTTVDSTATPEQAQPKAANNYNGWGANNTTDVTINYIGGGWYGGWGWNNWGYDGWGWNNWYGPGWGWNNWYGAGWGWNSWYGPGWGWNNWYGAGWGWNSWYGPGWGWGGYYGNPYFYGYGNWNHHYAYNGGRRNTIYRNTITPNSGRNFVATNRNGGRSNPDVRPTNLNVRPNSNVRTNTGTRTNPSNSTNVNTIRNNSIQNNTPTRSNTPTRTDTPTRSYSPEPSRSYSPSGGSFGGGGGGFSGGRGGGGGGRR